jgi:cell division protein FtsQ
VRGLLLALAAGLAYLAAVSTSLFAVRSIDVVGADPALSAQVRTALRPTLGESLVGVDLPALQRRVESLPLVASATLDRAFPHDVVVTVVLEHAVAVLRRGSASWLASSRGRVMGELPRGARPGLPRVWLGRGAPIGVGDTVAGDAGSAVRAVAPLAGSGLGLRVRSVVARRSDLTLLLRSGLEVRLGDGTQLPLKLAVTAAVVPRLDPATVYLDVAVPERPVAGTRSESQADVETQTSTTG